MCLAGGRYLLFADKIDAHIDLARGQYKLFGYGLPSPWRASYVAALRQRYGVEFHAVAGCIVSKAQQDYVAAYDDLSTEAVNRKFGHDVFQGSRRRELLWPGSEPVN